MKRQLKKRMTFEEMEAHMVENSIKVPNKVSVGKYARELGFSVYKPMVKGKIKFFYINESML
ncbi:hypothetical protein [Bacteroides sp. 51]|uniref:hypothetical protein n=1 Tax=Bacteroides sp. 51 TaxID=2302938 RepID=UPI0013D0FA13|nr:hypothetical protein [Bacteroides sp. 51]NDV80809.1 hypothetical protein [Bacteroides sp. 51]